MAAAGATPPKAASSVGASGVAPTMWNIAIEP
ncbi:Uncharacterised protein [Bordetella pertussis]|nr:Uncharacterised protein [Bordetella pertussis]